MTQKVQGMNRQLDIFSKDEEILMLRQELASVKASSDAVRKSLFARHNELAKMYLDLKAQLEGRQNNGIVQVDDLELFCNRRPI